MTIDDPGMREHIAGIQRQLQEALDAVNRLVDQERILRTAADLEAFEDEVGEVTDRVAGLIVGLTIQRSVLTDEAQAEAAAVAKASGPKMRNQGQREVAVRGVRGESVRVRTSYWSPNKHRGKRGKGMYPGLARLGIDAGCTPLLASDVARMGVVCGSFEEAAIVLAQRGLALDIKTIRDITYRFSQRARLVRESAEVAAGTQVAGRRVVVGVDGGRIRIRKNKRGPKTEKGRTRYSTRWREPKLLVIYVIDEKGEMDRQVSSLIDATMKGPDVVFGLVQHYLESMGITKADTVVFVADGAPWIWNRVVKLTQTLKLAAERVVRIVDFYHAVEHLTKVAALRKKWSAAERKRWVKRHRKLLLDGKVDEVIQSIDALCNGRGSKAMAKAGAYFTTYREHMGYAAARDRKVPIGSGAVESAIRRVVNLRIKGPGIFWHRENAEHMLMLRSFHKAGRWNSLTQIAFSAPVAKAA